MLFAAGAIEQPVSLTRALVTFGLDLGDAHDVVDRLATGAEVPVTLRLTPQGGSPFALSRFGLGLLPGGRGPGRVETAIVPADVLQAVEAWRLSQAERPARHEVLGIILRQWLSAQGWWSAPDQAEVVTLYRAE